MKRPSVQSRHVIACAAYIIGYPFLVLLFLGLGVFDFMRPIVEFSAFDLILNPDFMADACRRSIPCNLSYFAYFLVPLEVARRGIKLLFRGPMFPAPAHPRGPTWVHFVVWCLVLLLLQMFVLAFVELRMGILSADMAVGLSVLIAAGLMTRHSTRIQEWRYPSELVDAVLAGDAQGVLELLSAGSDPNAVRPEDGATPLHVAAGAAQLEVLTTLLANQATPQVHDHVGATPLHLAAASGDVDAPQVVAALLAAGADIHARDRTQSTPLHLAVKAGAPEIVSTLLDAGADPTLYDVVGETPISLYTGEENDISRRLKAGDSH